MSNLIHLKLNHTILGETASSSAPHRFQFNIPVDSASPISVEVRVDKKKVVSTHTTEISDGMLKFLQTETQEVPPELHAELRAITSGVRSATREVLTLIKYGLGWINLNELLMSSKDAEWSTDEVAWKPLPSLLTIVADGYSMHPLNETTASAIQQCIDSGFKPFVALRHLHKARNESIPHYKWIDATIAAELAIKEFLIRLRPEIATLLLEMPSPPLQKLYGTVLESFGMQRSPKLKEIGKGVEIRNKLVHRPGETTISHEDANTYVRDVEIAIYHLLISLYPDDPNIQYFYYAARHEPKTKQ